MGMQYQLKIVFVDNQELILSEIVRNPSLSLENVLESNAGFFHPVGFIKLSLVVFFKKNFVKS
jgi:hypothetical protein